MISFESESSRVPELRASLCSVLQGQCFKTRYRVRWIRKLANFACISSVSKFNFVENGPSTAKWTEMAENPAVLHFETHAIHLNTA